MSSKNVFKAILVIQTLGLLVYTFIAFKAEGANLFSVALNNVVSLTWSGQFNLDFLCYLIISGLWIMWRSNFSGKSILVGLVAMILGILFFAPYLLWLINKENGDLKLVLVGER